MEHLEKTKNHWSEIRNDYFEAYTSPKEGEALASISIDAWISENENEPGTVVARVLLSQHGDVLVDYHDSLARTDQMAQEAISEAMSRLRDYYQEYSRSNMPEKQKEYKSPLDLFIAEEVPFRMRDLYDVPLTRDIENALIGFVQNRSDIMFDHDAFADRLLAKYDELVHESVQSYKGAIEFLCASLNKEEGNEFNRKVEEFTPIFESTNYFGIYFYNGDNEYYLVSKEQGEYDLVLDDSPDFIGKNELRLLEGEQILSIANKEFTGYLAEYSRENTKGLIPGNELGGLRILETALAHLEHMVQTENGFEKAEHGFISVYNFKNHPERVCYVPENWDFEEDGPGITGQDIIDLCVGDKIKAGIVFELCDWQHPSTILAEWDQDDQAALDNLKQEILVNGLLEDVRQQLESEVNTTSYGEPQAWVYLKNGRSIEVTLEQEGLAIEDFYYSARLHCAEEEFDNKDYHSTVGIINSIASASANVDEIKGLLIATLRCNDQYPIKEHPKKVRLDCVIDGIEKRCSAHRGNNHFYVIDSKNYVDKEVHPTDHHEDYYRFYFNGEFAGGLANKHVIDPERTGAADIELVDRAIIRQFNDMYRKRNQSLKKENSASER